VTGWAVLLVPLCLGFVAGMLALASWAEQRVLSPRALIISCVRSARTRPEHAEQLVASQSERLLSDVA
jgi:hypothetical protein